MTQTFLVTGNAGQGKTTIATNIATALAQYGYDTLLLDGDIRTPKIGYQFGQHLPKKTVQDVLTGKIKLKEAIYQHPTGLKILFSSPANPITEHPIKILEELKKTAQVLIIDTPTNDARWYKQQIKTILVTHPDFPSVLEIIKLTKYLPKTEGIIINNLKGENCELSPGNISVLTNKKILGIIEEEKQIRATHKTGDPIVESHTDLKITKTIRAIAANLMNQQYITPLK
ncbi:hypothetical protein DRJ22_02945 [Candidatus Woesearchaeota archaeon]|nr:MAG: hypothetical protein B6U93_01320 [Candidatus Woesearchaeota archaeon ex4484_78]RLE46037.1 MAG: hypothetical protein DRJ22_02945 [Candidatus Woesearchaeota archaeon]